jgi:LacI family transcriptional regulator, galactose operon repressor
MTDAARTTLRDVAARAGVSATTVSRVLAENYPVAEATRRRVLRAIEELDFVANTHARALRGQGTPSLAFVLRDVRCPEYAAAAQGAQEEAARHGRLCLICTTGGDPARELAVIRQMREHGASAVILIGGVHKDDPYRDRMVEAARALDAVGSRLVFCGRPRLEEALPLTVVDYDNEGGAYRATNHLLANGHRRIAIVGGDPLCSVGAGRFDGFFRALADGGVPPDPALVRTGVGTYACGYRGTTELLESGHGFSAVFAITDTAAFGVLAALTDAGLRVPEDVSVVGYDNLEFSPTVRPGLTTVHVPHEELGRVAVRLALRSGPRGERTPRHVVFDTHVVVRDSVARRA